MALIKCTECGKEVSDSAGKCPGCGAKVVKLKPPKKPTSKLTWALVSVLVFAAVMGAQQQQEKNSIPAPVKTPQQIAADEKREGQLNIGTLYAMALKKGMKDPESFSLTYATVKQSGVTCYEYRAKNSFGAIFPGTAVLTSKRKLLVQEDNGNAFVSAWNKECTAAGGDSILALTKAIGIQ